MVWLNQKLFQTKDLESVRPDDVIQRPVSRQEQSWVSKHDGIYMWNKTTIALVRENIGIKRSMRNLEGEERMVIRVVTK